MNTTKKHKCLVSGCDVFLFKSNQIRCVNHQHEFKAEQTRARLAKSRAMQREERNKLRAEVKRYCALCGVVEITERTASAKYCRPCAMISNKNKGHNKVVEPKKDFTYSQMQKSANSEMRARYRLELIVKAAKLPGYNPHNLDNIQYMMSVAEMMS